MSMAKNHTHLITQNFLISLLLTLFLEDSLVFFEVFAKHVLSTKLRIASKVINSRTRLHTIFLKNPIDLLFFAP